MTHMNRSSSKTAIAAAHAALSTLVIATPETAIDRHVGAAEVPHAVYNQPTLVGSSILAGADSPDVLFETLVQVSSLLHYQPNLRGAR